MPSWFAKVFKGDVAKPKPVEKMESRDAIERPNPILEDSDTEEEVDTGRPALREQRNIIQPTVLVEEAEQTGYSEDVRIKAKLSADRRTCTFMVDRPILEGHSAYFPDPSTAGDSPLAQALFALKGVGQVTLHGMTVSVSAGMDMEQPWDEQAKDIGTVIRDHLKANKAVVTPDFLENLPPEDQIRQKLETIILTEINPAIAGHSGAISLERVEGNTVFIKMMGGCQGCAASAITLRQGIFTAFREAVPQIGAILDETDHQAGENPYFKKLPAEMQNA